MINKLNFVQPSYMNTKIGFKNNLHPKVKELLNQSIVSEDTHKADSLFQDLLEIELSENDVNAMKNALEKGHNKKPIKPEWKGMIKYLIKK